MTAQERKDKKYWENFNYYFTAYGCERTAHVVTKQELGYEPLWGEEY